MPELPTTRWGDPSASRRALLVHGLTSSGATWWRVAEALADDGWYVTAVDLRGNGDAPTAESYTFADYAGDLPRGGWQLVVGHSLGGAVAVVAANEPGFTERLVLLDPALEVAGDDLRALLVGELDELRLDDAGFRALRPTWHPTDVAHKASAVRRAGARMIERTVADNTPWTVLRDATTLPVRTLLVGGDPAVYSMLPAESAAAITAANPLVDYRAIAGSGHSPHRDRPVETIALLRDWLG
ncbi:MAG: alpha/beta hydrolase [Microbacteriaceae bacterium]|jgi:pimeloyl-ACP methyl ester carboxylesterase|nr:alpha/beta hydrolase [Microbacteriaceae bacterium]